jgi:hypothetical protein
VGITTDDQLCKPEYVEFFLIISDFGEADFFARFLFGWQ